MDSLDKAGCGSPNDATRQATKFEEMWLVKINGDWREYPCYQKYCNAQQIHVQIVGRLSPNENPA